MDAASTHSLGTPSTAWGAFSHSERPPRHSDPAWARLPLPATVGHLAVPAHETQANATSGTWTSFSGDLADLSDADDVEVRDEFVQEYNRVARKPGQQPLQQRRSWFSRTFLRQVSTTSDASSTKSDKKVKSKRSVSDLAQHLMNGARRDNLKDEDLQSLVRLCGKSKLYLPSEYAPGSLLLPTCFRATAQYLVQHGVFRIPGSVRIVNALYTYYCADGDVDEISSTICCPNLPSHIKAGAHDVASTFKRLLSGLPGGILGSLPLFDALVAIHGQLKGEPEFLKTKQTKLRARLIALAIGTVKSQLRRDLICAVFGLLCLIGRAAEKAPREDEHGRPLPTSDLMGFSALGIVFGPLLVGDLLNSYTMQVVDASSGPGLFPVTPPNARKERRRGVRPLSSGLASLLSPPVEEPSPAEFERPRSLGGVEHGQSYRPLANNHALNAAKSREGLHSSLSSPRTPTRNSESSKTTLNRWESAERQPRTVSRGVTNPFKGRLNKGNAAPDSPYRTQAGAHKTSAERMSQDTPRSIARGSFEPKASRDDKPKMDVFGLGRSRLAAWRSRRRSLVSTDTGSPVPPPSGPREANGDVTESASSTGGLLNHPKVESRASSADEGRGYPSQEYGGFQASAYLEHSRPLQVLSGNAMPQRRSLERANFWNEPDTLKEKAGRKEDKKPFHPETPRAFPLGPRPDPARPTISTVPRSRPVRSTGSAVKAMAAMFEGASKDPSSLPSSAERAATRADSKPSGMLSPYTVNPAPSKSPRPSDSIPTDRHMWLSTVRDRRSRGSGVRGDAARSSVLVPSRGEISAGLQSPGQDALNQPGPRPDTGGSPSAGENLLQRTPDTVQRMPTATSPTLTFDPQHGLTTPSPHLKPGNGWSKSPHTPQDGISPASTTRRSPLIPTPEHHRQRATSTTFAQTSRNLPANTSSPIPIPETDGSTTSHNLPHEQEEHEQNQPQQPLDPYPTEKPQPRHHHHHHHHQLEEEKEEQQDHDDHKTKMHDPDVRAGTVIIVDADDDNDDVTPAAELAAVRERLRLVERECAMWRARAERAERRVRGLLLLGGGGAATIGAGGAAAEFEVEVGVGTGEDGTGDEAGATAGGTTRDSGGGR
ncbi:hypothetical protein C8A01DRAFT_13519 [Parachaetomium inaequale]|uniref:Rho-GAP domain-containing protein n=1 Tax=Parachaetomium inaequale TaxID=2588326 RepID=A0AAN6PKZ5_9PEZI|nr:hypothetical protein C8A01DRAFT_13519 [Parachaetomium inaequale]